MKSKLFLIVEDHPQMSENIDRSLKLLEPSSFCTIASDPEQAKLLKDWGSDGVIVGSAIVKRLASGSPEEGLQAVKEFCESLKQAIA